MKSRFLLIALPILSLSMYCTGQIIEKNNNDYKTVKIGQQEWATSNLAITVFRNGDLIPQARTAEDWQKAGYENAPAWCYYNFDSVNGNIYGKLYNWYAVVDSRGIAPIGWHIPSDFDWNGLAKNLGEETQAGSKLKAKVIWENNGQITNESNFSALPGGGCRSDGSFYGLGSFGYWWSSSDDEMNLALFRFLSSSDNEFGEGNNGKGYGHSIRCIKD